MLELPDGERSVDAQSVIVEVITPFGGDHHGAQLVELAAVREARVAVVERIEAIHKSELVERDQPVLGGSRVLRVHLCHLVDREHPVAGEHGQDGAVARVRDTNVNALIIDSLLADDFTPLTSIELLNTSRTNSSIKALGRSMGIAYCHGNLSNETRGASGIRAVITRPQRG